MATNNNITDAEIALLKASRSSADWNAACKTIKDARDGAYPADWWPRIKLTGLMEEIVSSWGGDTEIRIVKGRSL